MTRREIRDLYVNTVESIREGAVSTPAERRLARALVNRHIATAVPEGGTLHIATIHAPLPEQEQLSFTGILASRGLVA